MAKLGRPEHLGIAGSAQPVRRDNGRSLSPGSTQSHTAASRPGPVPRGRTTARVVFTWGIAGNDVLPADSTQVEVLLTADGDDTVVELRDRDLPAVQVDSHRAGWPEFFGRLTQAAAR